MNLYNLWFKKYEFITVMRKYSTTYLNPPSKFRLYFFDFIIPDYFNHLILYHFKYADS